MAAAAATPNDTPTPAPAVTSAPASARADLEARGEAEQIGAQDSIPMHRVHVDTVRDADAAIVVDGEVNEAIWATLPAHDNMLVSIPATGKPGKYRTAMRFVATERGLYAAAIMEQPVETLTTRMSVRDDFIDRDTFGLTLDTSGEAKFAYWFIVGLGGALMDGKVLPERNFQRDWDGPWIGKTARRDDGWSAEMFLPWSMMNLPNQTTPRQIGFSVSRQVSHENARYQWPGHAYSSAQFVSALNHMTIEGVATRPQYALVPFAATTVDERHNANELRVGADVAYKPSPALEVAATLLPDFGSVEVDDVVLNLTAQETFFPEKRLFFLEGNEVFDTSLRANPGNGVRFTNNENFNTASRRVNVSTFVPAPISLFNTRRIGGIANQVRVPAGVTPLRGERALPTELLGAVKLTGGAGGFRYGVLSAFEDDVELVGTDASGGRVRFRDDGRDFAAVRGLYEHFRGSRHAIGYIGTRVAGPRYDAVTHAVDGHYTSADGRFMAEGLLIDTDVDDVDGNAMLLDFQYAPDSRSQHRVSLDWFDEDVNFNDFGFLRRNNYMGAQYNRMYANPNNGGRITDIRGTVIVRADVSVSDRHLVDGGIFWRNMMVLPGRNSLRSGFGFLPGGYEDRDSRGNGAYRTDDRFWSELILSTNASRTLSASFTAGAQQENLGDWSYLVGTGLTWRPTDRLSLDLELKYRDRHGWIVHQGGRNFGRYDAGELQPALKLNWFLAAAHQLNFTMQWAGARADERGFFAVPVGDGKLLPAVRTLPDYDFTVSLLTMQARYRYEIAPLTDLYVVYNRGNTLPNRFDEGFDDLLDEAVTHPIINSLVVKLRWRFGN